MAGKFLQFPKKNSGQGNVPKSKKGGKQNWKARQNHIRRKRKRGDWGKNAESERPKKKKRKTKSYKGRIRDLERMLKRPGLKVEIREAKEKELAQLKQDFQQHKVEAQNNHRHLRHNNKFGAPKFYDKRKLLRKLEKVNSALGRTEEDSKISELEKERAILLEDLNYIEKFPKHLKYISIIIARQKNDARQLKQINEVKEFLKKEKEKQEKSKLQAEEDESESEEPDEEFIKSVKASMSQKLAEEEKEEKEMEKELAKMDNTNSIKNNTKKVKNNKNIQENTEKINVVQEEIITTSGGDFGDALLMFADENDDIPSEKEEKKEKKIDLDVSLFLEDSDEEKKLSRSEKKKMGILKARQKKKKIKQ